MHNVLLARLPTWEYTSISFTLLSKMVSFFMKFGVEELATGIQKCGIAVSQAVEIWIFSHKFVAERPIVCTIFKEFSVFVHVYG